MRIRINLIITLFLSSVILAIYRIPIGPINISIDRILFLPSLLIIFGYYLKKGFLNYILYALLLILFVSTILNISYLKESFTFIPSYVLCLFYFWIAAQYSTFQNSIHLNRIINFSFWIILIFSIYGFYYRYVLGEIYFSYPLKNFLGNLSNDEHKINMIRYYRLFFPLSSAPRLGFVAALIFLYNKFYQNISKYNRVVNYGSILVLLLTISRGPIIALLLSLYGGYFFKDFKENRLSRQFKIIFAGISTLVLFTILFLNFKEDLGMFERFFRFATDKADNSVSGHLGIRMAVIHEMFSGNILDLFFGHGIGLFAYLTGTSSAHSTYFTIFYEQGLLGLIIMLGIFLSLVLMAIKNYLNNPIDENLGLLIIALYFFLIHLAYDATTTFPLWVFLGIIWGKINYRKT